VPQLTPLSVSARRTLQARGIKVTFIPNVRKSADGKSLPDLRAHPSVARHQTSAARLLPLVLAAIGRRK
jgi:hypothetical protein